MGINRKYLFLLLWQLCCQYFFKQIQTTCYVCNINTKHHCFWCIMQYTEGEKWTCVLYKTKRILHPWRCFVTGIHVGTLTIISDKEKVLKNHIIRIDGYCDWFWNIWTACTHVHYQIHLFGVEYNFAVISVSFWDILQSEFNYSIHSIFKYCTSSKRVMKTETE